MTPESCRQSSSIACRTEPLFAEIAQFRIRLGNEFELASPCPTFEVFLPSNGVKDFPERLGKNQAVNAVLGRESWVQMLPMLIHAPGKVIRDSDVERPRAVRHDVDPIGPLSGHHRTLALDPEKLTGGIVSLRATVSRSFLLERPRLATGFFARAQNDTLEPLWAASREDHESLTRRTKPIADSR
jgi:hypothetical protein